MPTINLWGANLIHKAIEGTEYKSHWKNANRWGEQITNTKIKTLCNRQIVYHKGYEIDENSEDFCLSRMNNRLCERCYKNA